MILILTSPPNMLFEAITFARAHYPKEEAVLFAHEGIYRSRLIKPYAEKLKENGIFKDVVFCDSLFESEDSFENLESFKQAFIEHFDLIFAESGYSLSDFSKIFCINDDWDGYFNLYLNLKQMKIIVMKQWAFHQQMKINLTHLMIIVLLMNKWIILLTQK